MLELEGWILLYLNLGAGHMNAFTLCEFLVFLIH